MKMKHCQHQKMESSARRDYCPDCKYEFYYGDAHAQGEAQISKLVNPGDDAQCNNPGLAETFVKRAEFLDQFIDHLEVKCSHWLFTKYSEVPEEQRQVHWQTICDFVKWVAEDTAQDKAAKRGRTGLSYEHCQKQWENVGKAIKMYEDQNERRGNDSVGEREAASTN